MLGFFARIKVEHLSLQGVPFCGGTAHSMKVFEQIPRELAYRIAHETCLPVALLDDYRRA